MSNLGILSMYASPEAAAANNVELQDRRYYIDSMAPADCILSFDEVVLGAFDVKKTTNPDAGQPWISIKFTVSEGTIGLSEKGRSGYSNFSGSKGDSVSLFYNLSMKQAQAKIDRTFGDLQEITAVLTGNRPAVYDATGERAGRLLEDLQALPAGTLVRMTQTKANKNGYYDRLFELVPGVPAAPAKSAKKAS